MRPSSANIGKESVGTSGGAVVVGVFVGVGVLVGVTVGVMQLIGVLTQPVAGSHVSAVQALLSSQFSGVTSTLFVESPETGPKLPPASLPVADTWSATLMFEVPQLKGAVSGRLLPHDCVGDPAGPNDRPDVGTGGPFGPAGVNG